MRRLCWFAIFCWTLMGVNVSMSVEPSKVEPALPVAAAKELLEQPSDLRPFVEQFVADEAALFRFYDVPLSATRRARRKQLFESWQTTLDGLPFEKLSREGQLDWLLLHEHLATEIRRLDFEAEKAKEIAPLVPFADEIAALSEARQKMEFLDPKVAAEQLTETEKQVAKSIADADAKIKSSSGEKVPKHVAARAAKHVGQLKTALDRWFGFYHEYDPVFTWWNEKPHAALAEGLNTYAKKLKEGLAGLPAEGEASIAGDPIGREALLVDLADERIPYTPEELIAIGDKEYAWCEAEMKAASRELGFGDDWLKAVELVKNRHEPPGGQPTLIRDLANEAIIYLEQRDLMTIPPVAKESWRMEMMSPERQLVNPFFLGGEEIIVSYPTRTMTHEQKRMSMRGNNRHFARATVQHELIPGHHMQQYMTQRYRPHRELFDTPFWTEGWALYWEMRLYEMGFPRSAEDRVGMLFWRMHRCARITFSLRFHLGLMSPAECIQFLIDRVGHEPDNAAAEVRRSLSGSYPPLYQAGYMLGGLQFRAMHKELVVSGKMTERQFHDTILKEGRIPVELLRALMTDQPFSRDMPCKWRFYDAQ